MKNSIKFVGVWVMMFLGILAMTLTVSVLSVSSAELQLISAVEKLEKDFPEEEVKSFTGTLIPLMAEAMHLNAESIPDEEYYEKAEKIKGQIIGVVNSPARHLGIRAIQDIFRDHGDSYTT